MRFLMKRSLATALALLLALAVPLCATAQSDEVVTEDFENGHWFFESASQGVRIEINRLQDDEEKVLWYEADLQFSPQSPLLFLLSNYEKPGRNFAYPEKLMRENGVVFGINGDQFGHRIYNRKTVGIVVRDGQIISERTLKSGNKFWPTLDTAAFFDDGTMKVFSSAEHDAQDYLDMGAKNVLAFGPWLIKQGEINPLFRTNFHAREPRSAIGMIEPYHFVVISVEGRIRQSRGTDMRWLAARMQELGCSEAFNLDGGRTCCIVFMGKKLEMNNPKGLVKDGRSVSDMIGLGHSEQLPEYTGLDK